MIHFLFIVTLLFNSGFSFMFPRDQPSQSLLKNPSQTSLLASSQETLLEPSKRDSHYGRNIAQYLVDLHDNKTTFDFCGGMMFQLCLSNKLRDHLISIANEDDNNQQQPVIFDASKFRMSNINGYSKKADADNVRIFHGRELRQVPDAEGGMGFVLQLSLANGDDPEGWSKEEIQTYDGWGHDSGRTWRKADVYESEGFTTFKSTFGSKAFGLNHRFYLHYDSDNRMWLSAEDGCEGTPSSSPPNLFSRIFE